MSALLHNASHANIRPRWLRRILGEAVGLWQLMSFPSWFIVHVLHHKNPDDPVLDPHPPMGQSYLKFLFGMRQKISTVFINHYFSLWGDNDESKRCLKELGIESQVAMFLQALFWYLLLGPQIFTFLFIASVIFKMAHYAWFNYATHVYTDEGPVIVDLNQGLYKVVNLLGFGLYHHKSHHDQASLYNPSKIKTQVE